DESRFRLLFGSLTGNELADILGGFQELRQSGSKMIRVSTLWDAHRSERTLLNVLMNRQLEDVLYRLELRLAGSKAERTDRLIEHLAAIDPTTHPQSAGAVQEGLSSTGRADGENH